MGFENIWKYVSGLIASVCVAVTFGAPLDTTTVDPASSIQYNHVQQRLGIMTDMVYREQQSIHQDYCLKVEHRLVGVDHVVEPEERCKIFSEQGHKWTNLRMPTKIEDMENGVKKSDMELLLKDLHYWQHVLHSVVETGTRSLHKYSCIVEDENSLHPCTSVTCGAERAPDQELYCRMHDSLAPLLKNTIDVIKKEIGMENWVEPTYEVIDPPHPDMKKLLVQLYTVVISHYITKELEIAKEAAPKYIIQ